MSTTPRDPRKLERLRRANRRLRARLSASRRWLVALAVALAAVGTFAVTEALEPEPAAGTEETVELVPLGTGMASVDAPSEEGAVGEPARIPPALEEPRAAEPASGRQIAGGEASFYHESLAGRPTASGVPYRPERLTAAHRTLPFGSKVRVTNLANGRQVIVEINDRGPFHRGRVIDLSRSAARAVGLFARGHGKVRMELLDT